MPHIRELCIIEMIARTCKRIMRHEFAETLFYKFKEENKEHYKKIDA